jgi:hypothetical protein
MRPINTHLNNRNPTMTGLRDIPPIIASVVEEIAEFQRPGCQSGYPHPSRSLLISEYARTDVSLIVSTLTGSMLLPLLIALFVFSDGYQRRQPVFMAVVLAVLIGLAQSIYSDWFVVRF